MFAAESYGYGETYINTKEDIEGAKRAYEALTPEAKRIFEQALIYDAETLEFQWKLKDSQRRRIASLKNTGEVVGK